MDTGNTCKRPNYFENRYNQWVMAGKIAVKTGAINPYLPDGKLAPIYKANDGDIHYSVIGQDYLQQLDLSATEL